MAGDVHRGKKECGFVVTIMVVNGNALTSKMNVIMETTRCIPKNGAQGGVGHPNENESR